MGGIILTYYSVYGFGSYMTRSTWTGAPKY